MAGGDVVVPCFGMGTCKSNLRPRARDVFSGLSRLAGDSPLIGIVNEARVVGALRTRPTSSGVVTVAAERKTRRRLRGANRPDRHGRFALRAWRGLVFFGCPQLIADWIRLAIARCVALGGKRGYRRRLLQFAVPSYKVAAMARPVIYTARCRFD